MEINQELKTCGSCSIQQPFSEFTKNKSKKDGLALYCKKCNNLKSQKYRVLNKEIIPIKRKINYEKNKETLKLISKNYREINLDKTKIAQKKWRENNPEKSKKSTSNWQKNNKNKINLYLKNKRKTDPLFKLKNNIRAILNKEFKKQGYKKSAKTGYIIGCSFEKLKTHIESQFQSWMNWNNHGKYNGNECYGWDIDHIRPLSSAKTEEDVVKLNHYTNLQPLCSFINRVIKRDN